jgi:hypothetical protein
MDLLTATLNALMLMTPHKTDTESLDERRARMTMIAESIQSATKRAACVNAGDDCKPILSDRRLATALLLGKGHFESDFAQYVHEGHCDQGPIGARCDSDKQGIARAHGPWQQWRLSVYPQTDWDNMQGATPKATTLAAEHALELLAGTLHRCPDQYPGDNIAQAIAGFAGTCITMKPEKVQRQAAYVRKILNSLPAE